MKPAAAPQVSKLSKSALNKFTTCQKPNSLPLHFRKEFKATLELSSNAHTTLARPMPCVCKDSSLARDNEPQNFQMMFVKHLAQHALNTVTHIQNLTKPTELLSVAINHALSALPTMTMGENLMKHTDGVVVRTHTTPKSFSSTPLTTSWQNSFSHIIACFLKLLVVQFSHFR